MTYILLFVVLAAATYIFIASRKPDVFRLERRAIIPAAPDIVFNQINDLAAWQRWSPWAEKDPNAKGAFGASSAGPGASFTWDGNKQVGRGTMTIIESSRPSHVAMRLDFEAPFKATNRADFRLSPVDGGTEVVWSMEGPANLVAKVMDQAINMDKVVGKDFERGLDRLRAAVAAG